MLPLLLLAEPAAHDSIGGPTNLRDQDDNDDEDGDAIGGPNGDYYLFQRGYFLFSMVLLHWPDPSIII